MEWYYALDDQKVGPISEDNFAALVANRTIGEHTLVWTQGMSDWKRWRELRSSPELFEGSLVAMCAQSGQVFPKDQMVRFGNVWVSAEHKDTYLQRVQEGVADAGEMQLGSIWMRFVAKFVDHIIFGVVSYALMMAIFFGFSPMLSDPDANQETVGMIFIALMLACYALIFLFGAAYNWYFLPRYGATPGKMATRLRVTNSDGSFVSPGKAIGRYLAELLNGFTFGIGYLIACFDDEKRTLHDHICSTRVLVKR